MIKWNKVTWYSKLGAIILFIAVVPALTFYIGVQYEKTLVTLNQAAAWSSRPVKISTPATPGATSSAGSSVTITQATLGQTLTVHQGEEIVLALPDSYVWSNFSVDNPAIVSKVSGALLPAGAQALYRANAVGSTTLSANGGPHCTAGQACPMFLLLFKVGITVVK